VAWFSFSRRRAERLLAEAHDDLEIRVTQRTAEFTIVNGELQSTQAELQSQKKYESILCLLSNILK
jgi:C4-dicarboxylate-specific signal transduction histidine kinase